MTKQEAISELTRAAELCPTTPLAEACRYALAMMNGGQNCGTCKHAAKTSIDAPCRYCNFVCGDLWEPKGVDNGKTD